MSTQEFLDFIEKNIMTEEDKENIFMPPLEPQVALNILRDHFLGKDWYTVNPVGVKQVNTEIVYNILKKYPVNRSNKKWLFRKIKNIMKF